MPDPYHNTEAGLTPASPAALMSAGALGLFDQARACAYILPEALFRVGVESDFDAVDDKVTHYISLTPSQCLAYGVFQVWQYGPAEFAVCNLVDYEREQTELGTFPALAEAFMAVRTAVECAVAALRRMMAVAEEALTASAH